MRAFENFHSLHIDHIGDAAANPCQWHAIDCHAHRGFERCGERIGPDTTDIEAVEFRFSGGIEGQSGYELRKFDGAGDAGLIDGSGRHGDDGNGDILDAFRPLVRGDHDFEILDLIRAIGLVQLVGLLRQRNRGPS